MSCARAVAMPRCVRLAKVLPLGRVPLPLWVACWHAAAAEHLLEEVRARALQADHVDAGGSRRRSDSHGCRQDQRGSHLLDGHARGPNLASRSFTHTLLSHILSPPHRWVGPCHQHAYAVHMQVDGAGASRVRGDFFKTALRGLAALSTPELDLTIIQISFASVVALVSCSPPSLCSRSPRPPAWRRCPRGPTASACRRAAAGSSSRRSAALLSRLRALRRVHLPRLASSASRTSSALAVRHSPIARACARTFEAHRAVWGEHDASRVHGDGSRTPGWGLWAGVEWGCGSRRRRCVGLP